MPTKKVDGISGVKLLTGENSDLKSRLGMSGVDRRQHNNVLFRKHDIPTIGNVVLCGSPKEHRSNSIDNHHMSMASRDDEEPLATKFITDSATITIPLQISKGALDGEDGVIFPPKYKTMPSPTKSSNAILNEIFEEGTDVGSSDNSATTTPRPANRHSHFTNNRTQSTAQRRSKFHKTRTASCSSSDASDDDSENRKKRAHKIVDSTGKPFHQRRDSHDDSSDSQDPGNATAGGVGTGGSAAGAAFCQPLTTTSTNSSNRGQKSETNTTNSNGQAKGQQVGFRRHRAGRRKAGETRLRESQSLNRITEVQESDIALISLTNGGAAISNATVDDSNNLSPSPEPHRAVLSDTGESPVAVSTKPKGFSARLLQGFKKSSSENKEKSHNNGDVTDASGSKDVDVGIVGVDHLTKALKSSESKTTTATKKLKMLGKYFQVRTIDGIVISGRHFTFLLFLFWLRSVFIGYNLNTKSYLRVWLVASSSLAYSRRL